MPVTQSQIAINGNPFPMGWSPANYTGRESYVSSRKRRKRPSSNIRKRQNLEVELIDGNTGEKVRMPVLDGGLPAPIGGGGTPIRVLPNPRFPGGGGVITIPLGGELIDANRVTEQLGSAWNEANIPDLVTTPGPRDVSVAELREFMGKVGDYEVVQEVFEPQIDSGPVVDIPFGPHTSENVDISDVIDWVDETMAQPIPDMLTVQQEILKQLHDVWFDETGAMWWTDPDTGKHHRVYPLGDPRYDHALARRMDEVKNRKGAKEIAEQVEDLNSPRPRERTRKEPVRRPKPEQLPRPARRPAQRPRTRPRIPLGWADPGPTPNRGQVDPVTVPRAEPRPREEQETKRDKDDDYDDSREEPGGPCWRRGRQRNCVRPFNTSGSRWSSRRV